MNIYLICVMVYIFFGMWGIWTRKKQTENEPAIVIACLVTAWVFPLMIIWMQYCWWNSVGERKD